MESEFRGLEDADPSVSDLSVNNLPMARLPKVEEHEQDELDNTGTTQELLDRLREYLLPIATEDSASQPILKMDPDADEPILPDMNMNGGSAYFANGNTSASSPTVPGMAIPKVEVDLEEEDLESQTIWGGGCSSPSLSLVSNRKRRFDESTVEWDTEESDKKKPTPGCPPVNMDHDYLTPNYKREFGSPQSLPPCALSPVSAHSLAVSASSLSPGCRQESTAAAAVVAVRGGRRCAHLLPNNPVVHLSVVGEMSRRAVAFGVRTALDNSIDNQGSDSANIITIGVTDGSNRLIIEVSATTDWDLTLAQLEEAAGEGAILVCRGATELRQVLHPFCVRQTVTPSPLFFEFINLSRLDPSPYPDPIDNQLDAILERVASYTEDQLATAVERILIDPPSGLCGRDEQIEEDVVVRARGLPWQATDSHVAQFFAGLNIAPGGIALCLSNEGRRNGEALVRFENSEQRTLALKRHRHFLLARYIEVYRASGEEFLQVAAGCSTETMSFVSRGAAMIVRMRGLPYDCTEDRIKDFFRQDPDACDIMEKGVMFVTRPDGRPTGDAFVLFGDEESGAKALTKHRQSIGNRYIELFRSTSAEVIQVMKRSTDVSPQTQTVRRDCVRLRGLPYEARVEHVVDFLGDHARNIVFQGVHMVFNSQGHPSGEAFIQMNSDASAASAASGAHNKFMTIGKKQRYIEVFQCAHDDMHLVMGNSGGLQQAPVAAPAPPLVMPQVPQRMPFATPTAMPLPFGAMYWPYPSPPVSPNMMLAANGQILVTGIGLGVSPQDIANQFSTQENIVETVQMLRWPSATGTGEALVRYRNMADASAAPPLLMDPSQLASMGVGAMGSLNTMATMGGAPHLPHLFPLIHT